MQSITDADLLTAIHRTLDEAKEPLTANKLRTELKKPDAGLPRPFRVSKDRLQELLEQEADAGRLHRFAPYRGKADRYWTRDLTEYARELILRTLKKKPSTRTEVKKALAKAAKGFTELEGLLQRMVAGGEICEHPPLPRSRTRRLGLDPPDPGPYFKDGVDRVRKVVELLAEAGVPVERSLDVFWERLQAALGIEPPSAPPVPPGERREMEPSMAGEPGRGEPAAAKVAAETSTVDRSMSLGPEEPVVSKPHASEWDMEQVSQRLLQALPQVEPRAIEGAPVSLTRLRQWPSLMDIPKAVFDRAALELATRGVVTLNQHDYPATLPQEERQKLVQDDRGRYYIGIALRR